MHRRVDALRNDAFEAGIDRCLERGPGIADAMRAVGQPRQSLGQQPLQQLLALKERNARQIHAFQVQQVEHDVAQRALAFAGQDLLEPVEILATALSRHQFAIQHCLLQAEQHDGGAHFRHAHAPVQRIARPQAWLACTNRAQQSIAIPLEFVQPVLALGWIVDQLGELRDGRRRGKRALACARQRQRFGMPIDLGDLRGSGSLLDRHRGLAHWLRLRARTSRAFAIFRRRRCHVVQHVVGLTETCPGIVLLEQQPLRLARRLA